MTTKVRVRFAPSPTGYLHVGGARSALFNYLFAKKMGGAFILRIEDTDRTRFVDGALEEIFESLRWLGITWDEGPGVGGGFGPYTQSERLAIYQQYAEQLLRDGHAYRCFCTTERLTEMRATQEREKTQQGYDRRCRHLSSDEVDALVQQGLPSVVRFKIPAGRTVTFEDQIRGAITYKSDILDDLVLLKTDGFPTYHLANVIDDHLMEISHVLRGDEWITSTPRHVLIYEAFGWTPPLFAHLPIILSAQGGKLSKRKGAASVLDYKNSGFLPEALFNFLALLGWSPGGDREKMTLQEMTDLFSLEQVSPKSAVFDETKLEWMNGLYLTEQPVELLATILAPQFRERGWEGDASYMHAVIGLLQSRSKRLTDLVDTATYFFVDPATYDEKAARKHFTVESVELLVNLVVLLQGQDDCSASVLEALYRADAEQREISVSKLIHPTRLAVSGVSAGPGLFGLLEVLGKECIIRRLNSAITYIKGMTT